MNDLSARVDLSNLAIIGVSYVVIADDEGASKGLAFTQQSDNTYFGSRSFCGKVAKGSNWNYNIRTKFHSLVQSVS